MVRPLRFPIIFRFKSLQSCRDCLDSLFSALGLTLVNEYLLTGGLWGSAVFFCLGWSQVVCVTVGSIPTSSPRRSPVYSQVRIQRVASSSPCSLYCLICLLDATVLYQRTSGCLMKFCWVLPSVCGYVWIGVSCLSRRSQRPICVSIPQPRVYISECPTWPLSLPPVS